MTDLEKPPLIYLIDEDPEVITLVTGIIRLISRRVEILTFEQTNHLRNSIRDQRSDHQPDLLIADISSGGKDAKNNPGDWLNLLPLISNVESLPVIFLTEDRYAFRKLDPLGLENSQEFRKPLTQNYRLFREEIEKILLSS